MDITSVTQWYLGWKFPFLPAQQTLHKQDAPEEGGSLFCQGHVSNCAALIENSRLLFSLPSHNKHTCMHAQHITSCRNKNVRVQRS